MAELDLQPIPARPAPHDGEVRCGVCATADADAAHEWCPAVSRLVCDDCCHRTLIGDVGRHMAAAFAGAGQAPVVTACSRCERGQAWLAGEVLDAMANETLPS